MLFSRHFMGNWFFLTLSFLFMLYPRRLSFPFCVDFCVYSCGCNENDISGIRPATVRIGKRKNHLKSKKCCTWASQRWHFWHLLVIYCAWLFRQSKAKVSLIFLIWKCFQSHENLIHPHIFRTGTTYYQTGSMVAVQTGESSKFGIHQTRFRRNTRAKKRITVAEPDPLSMFEALQAISKGYVQLSNLSQPPV